MSLGYIFFFGTSIDGKDHTKIFNLKRLISVVNLLKQI